MVILWIRVITWHPTAVNLDSESHMTCGRRVALNAWPACQLEVQPFLVFQLFLPQVGFQSLPTAALDISLQWPKWPQIHPQLSNIINSNPRSKSTYLLLVPSLPNAGEKKTCGSPDERQNYRACLLEVAITDTTSASAASGRVGIGCRALIWYHFAKKLSPRV